MKIENEEDTFEEFFRKQGEQYDEALDILMDKIHSIYQEEDYLKESSIADRILLDNFGTNKVTSEQLIYLLKSSDFKTLIKEPPKINLNSNFSEKNDFAERALSNFGTLRQSKIYYFPFGMKCQRLDNSISSKFARGFRNDE